MHFRLNNITSLIIFSFVCLGSYFSVTEFVKAEYIEPGSVSPVTEKYSPEITPLPEASYTYQVSWEGLTVGEASVAVSNDEKISSTFVKASAKSGKVIDLFYKLRHSSESSFDAKSFQPIKFVSKQIENNKAKNYTIQFKTDGQIESVYEKNGKTEEVKTFKSNNFTLDPITAAFFARSISIKPGSSASFDVFNGKHRYIITFVVKDEEKIEIMGVERDAYKVIPKVVKLTDTAGENRFREGYIWISKDSKRDILKLESEVLVGSITSVLTKVEYGTDKKLPKVEFAQK